MGIPDRIKNLLTKQSSVPSTQPTTTSTRSAFEALYGFKPPTNPYNNNTTWRKIYDAEPHIRGLIDTLVKAVVQDFRLVSLEPDNNSVDTQIKKIRKWFNGTDRRFQSKRLSVVTRLIMDSRVAAELDFNVMESYTLDGDDWDILWNEDSTFIDSIAWQSLDVFDVQNKNAGLTIPMDKVAMTSIHDPYGDLWNLSIIETLIDVANLFHFAMRHNINVFAKGGMPSYLFMLDEETGDPAYNQFKRAIKGSKVGQNITSRGNVQTHQLAGSNKDLEYQSVMEQGLQAVMVALGISPVAANLIQRAGSGERKENNTFIATVHSLQVLEEDFWTQVVRKLFSKKSGGETTEESGKVGRPQEDLMDKIVFKIRRWTDPREQAALHKIYGDMGVMTINEMREQIGLEPVPWGTKPPETGSPSGNTGGDQPSRDGEENKPKPEVEDNGGDETQGQSATQTAESG